MSCLDIRDKSNVWGRLLGSDFLWCLEQHAVVSYFRAFAHVFHQPEMAFLPSPMNESLQTFQEVVQHLCLYLGSSARHLITLSMVPPVYGFCRRISQNLLYCFSAPCLYQWTWRILDSKTCLTLQVPNTCLLGE